MRSCFRDEAPLHCDHNNPANKAGNHAESHANEEAASINTSNLVNSPDRLSEDAARNIAASTVRISATVCRIIDITS